MTVALVVILGVIMLAALAWFKVAGVVVTILAESVALIIYAFIKGSKRK
jgi:hypothetical protein